MLSSAKNRSRVGCGRNLRDGVGDEGQGLHVNLKVVTQIFTQAAGTPCKHSDTTFTLKRVTREGTYRRDTRGGSSGHIHLQRKQILTPSRTNVLKLMHFMVFYIFRREVPTQVGFCGSFT